jgi:hypothetical protein
MSSPGALQRKVTPLFEPTPLCRVWIHRRPFFKASFVLESASLLTRTVFIRLAEFCSIRSPFISLRTSDKINDEKFRCHGHEVAALL